MLDMDPSVEEANHALYDDGAESDAVIHVESAAAGAGASASGMALDMTEEVKNEIERLSRHHAEQLEATQTSSAAVTPTGANSSAQGQNAGSGGAAANGASSVSAVYRWYDIEDGFGLKRREESSIAKCKLCRQQGKLERKACVRFSKSVTSNLWRHLKENHPEVYAKHASEKKTIQMHRLVGAKKRGRKKKVATPTTLGDTLDDREDKLLEIQEEEVEQSDSSLSQRRKYAKKAKRNQQQFFNEYQLSIGNGTTALQQTQQQASSKMAGINGAIAGSSALAMTTFSPDKVREALGYLCLYEMLPFELCSSHALRNLMAECSGGLAGYADETNSMAMFGKEIALAYAKKLAGETKARVLIQTKMADFAHLMISEWRASNFEGDASHTDDGNERTFLALFAVGLDQDFHAYRRCLHVLSVGDAQDTSIAMEIAADEDLKKAVERVVPCKYMPQVLAIEPRSQSYQSFCNEHKLDFLESVSTLLQNIMFATINEISVTESFHLGTSLLSVADGTTPVGVRNRRLDTAEFIEIPTVSVTGADGFYELLEPETSSSILEELPTSLTGHTHRDLMNKVLYLLAHMKQSRKTRRVLQKITMEELGMDSATYERIFISGLRETVISISSIYYVLSLVFEMMPTLTRYFSLHKDGPSDFSKLIQLTSLSAYEWSRIAYLKTILKPFAEAAAKLDAEKYVVSSLLIPSIYTLLEKLRDTHPTHQNVAFADDGHTILGFTKKTSTNGSDDGSSSMEPETFPEDIVALKDLAFANLTASFGYLFLSPEVDWSLPKRQTFNLLWSATLLDPRTRPFIIKGPLSQMEFWELVKVEAANIAGTKMKDKENSNDLSETAIALDDDQSALDENGASKNGGDLWDDLQANLTSCAQEEMLSSKSSLEIAKSSNLLEVEVSFFQEENRISLRANPLEWWQNVRIKYPFLARLARYVLSIPGNVKVKDNPVAMGCGLAARAPRQMSMSDLCELLCASMNLRTEKNPLYEASTKPMWSTV